MQETPGSADPFSSSRAPTQQAAATVAGFNVKAVAVGVAVDIGGSLVLGCLVILAAALAMGSRGAAPEQMAAELTGSQGMQVFSLIAGMLMSVVGGYTAARSAARSYVKHALAAGVIVAAFGLVVLIADVARQSPPADLWITGASLVLVPACAALGGFLASPRELGPAEVA